MPILGGPCEHALARRASMLHHGRDGQLHAAPPLSDDRRACGLARSQDVKLRPSLSVMKGSVKRAAARPREHGIRNPLALAATTCRKPRRAAASDADLYVISYAQGAFGDH